MYNCVPVIQHLLPPHLIFAKSFMCSICFRRLFFFIPIFAVNFVLCIADKKSITCVLLRAAIIYIVGLMNHIVVYLWWCLNKIITFYYFMYYLILIWFSENFRNCLHFVLSCWNFILLNNLSLWICLLSYWFIWNLSFLFCSCCICMLFHVLFCL